MNSSSQNKEVAKISFLYMLSTRRNRKSGSFLWLPLTIGGMTFGEERGGESRARRTLRRSRKPCQGNSG